MVQWATLGMLTACYMPSCTDPESDPCEVKTLSVAPTSVSLPVLATSGVTATVTFGQREGVIEGCNLEGTPLVRWTSRDPSIATARGVGDRTGEIVAVAPGSVTVDVTVGGRLAGSNKQTTVAVTVVQIVPAVRLSASALTLVVGQPGTVTASVVDQGGRDVTSSSTVVWSSSNQAIATINSSSGAITAVAKGASTLTATATVAGVTASATVVLTVTDPPVLPVASLTLVGAATVRATETIVLEAKAFDASGAIVTDPTLSWQSSAPTKGTVTRTPNAHVADLLGILVGKVTVTATAASGKTATIDVDVIPGPVSRVVVTSPTQIVRAGLTVQLSAAATDANGNAVIGQTFTWASATPALASVDASGLVTAIAGGSPNVSATANGTTVSGRADLTILPRRVAYALADQPLTSTYTANPAHAFNSAAGSISITRLGVGIYRVAFPGQQPRTGEVETFMVTAYGPGNGFCKLASWGNGSGTDLVADVRCFAFGGAPGDSPFTISLVSDGSLGNRFGFAFANQPTQASYLPINAYNRSPTPGGAELRVNRLSAGRYSVSFVGNGGGATDPEAIMVTAVGTDNVRCQPGSLLTNETVRVNCWAGNATPPDESGVPMDSRFTIVLADRGRGSGERAGFVFVEDTDVINAGGSLQIPSFNAHNSTTGSVRVQKVADGRFNVSFAGFAGGPSGARFSAHVADMDEDDPAYCTVAGWAISGSDLVVNVACWHEEDGLPEDDAFYLFVIQ